MIERRRLFAAGGLLGAFIAPTTDAGAGGAAGQSERDLRDTVDAIKSVRAAIGSLKEVPEIGAIRQRQLDYLKAQGKFPDFIEVSAELWFSVYDWHVKNLQPVTLGRDGNNRYTIMLLYTAVVMRPDTVPTFISVPYDAR